MAGRQPGKVASSDLGFILGPRLNAAGRLDDMSIGIELLLCEDPQRAQEYAQQLDDFNKDRKSIEQGMQREALKQLKELPEDNLPFGLCLFDPEWHQGVIGILASRLKEKYHRPALAFADDGSGNGMLKGSARSVPGLHIRDALDAVATRHPGLITKFGGHAMAAGLSLPQAHYETFAAAFDAEVRRHLQAEDLSGRLQTDGCLAPAEFQLAWPRPCARPVPGGSSFPSRCSTAPSRSSPSVCSRSGTSS